MILKLFSILALLAVIYIIFSFLLQEFTAVDTWLGGLVIKIF